MTDERYVPTTFREQFDRLTARLAEVEAERERIADKAMRLEILVESQPDTIAQWERNANEWRQKASRAEAERDHITAELAATNQALKAHTDLLDEARTERDAARKDWENATDLAEMIRDRNHYCGYAEALRADLAEANLDRDAMRLVVEAAEFWRTQQTLHPPFPDDEALMAAVDAYRAGQKAPAAAPESSSDSEVAL